MASPDREYSQAEVLVATTWKCNLRCSYCFVDKRGLTEGGGCMSPRRAKRVIEALDEGMSDVETICVHLYGGEPLTNLRAAEAMVAEAGRRAAGRFAFAVTTNGTCLSQRVLELLQAGRFQVILSIDGPIEIHDECRRMGNGRPSHARVLSFLQALRRDTDCLVRGSAVVRSGWSLRAAVDYLSSLPVDSIKAQAVRVPDGAPYRLTAEEKQAYMEDLDAVGGQVVAELEAGQVPRDDRFSNRVLQLLAGMERDSFCAAGETTFGITPTGDVLPCVLMDSADAYLGHVNEDPMTWREAGRVWRELRRPRPECRGCAARPLCGGGCPAIMPVCSADECDYIRKNCEVATSIYAHFRDAPEKLLALAGIV